LLETHLKLMEENRRLQDALLRLRKKLLSLSNAASAAAGKLPRHYHCGLCPHFAIRACSCQITNPS
jgi:hypothetical protein